MGVFTGIKFRSFLIPYLFLCYLTTLCFLFFSNEAFSQSTHEQPVSGSAKPAFIIKNANGTQLGKFTCSRIIPVRKNVLVKSKDNTQQLVTLSDSVLAPPFDSISTFQYGIAKAFDEQSPPLSILKSNGRTFPELFAKVAVDSPGVVRGKISRKRLASLSSKQPALWELLDTTGQLIVPPYYQKTGPVSQGLIRVNRKGKWGYIDTRGFTVVSCILDSAGNFEKHYAPARLNGQTALIDTDGRIYPFPFHQPPDPLTKHLFRFKADSLYGLISRERDTIVQPDFDNIEKVSSDLFSIKKEQQYGLINKNGQVLLRPIYDSLKSHLPYGFMQGYTEEGVHFYDISRDSITLNSSELSYNLQGIHEGFICIKRKGKYGYIDHLGRNRIAYRYKDIRPITEGYARIRIQGKWGAVDKKGDITIQPYYEYIGPFIDSLAAVKYQDEWGIIQTDGNTRIPHTLDTVYHHQEGYWMLEKDGKRGMLTGNGEYSFHPRFTKIQRLGKHFFAVLKNNKWGVVRTNGNQILPCKYKQIRYYKKPGYFVCKPGE